MQTKIRIWKSNKDSIIIMLPYNPEYISKIKTLDGYKWHPTGKYWNVPYTNTNFNQLQFLFDDEELLIDPKLFLERLREELISRNYSQKTVRIYYQFNLDFLKYINKTPMEITSDDVTTYFYHLSDERGASASTLNTAFSALKFYYGELLNRNFINEIIRPKRDRKLPVILSQDEVQEILPEIENLKHRVILMLIYSAGLRVGEAVKLTQEDIDTQRKLIHIRGAKGRKDRYTILSENVVEQLDLYVKYYQPKKWLFPGYDKDKHISVRTVEKVFEKVVKKSKVKKNVTVHSLRHSFATHLLENGVDLRFIQKILGHKSSKTTELYTHVTNKDLIKIKSPLDVIMGTRDTVGIEKVDED